MEPIIDLKELVEESHGTACKSGFWGEDPAKEPYNFAEKIALMHSELSEALEEHRNGREPTEIYYSQDKNGRDKPEGVCIELADLLIRVADLCGRAGINLNHVVNIKLAYNKTRPYKHGKVC